ncbi:MAG: CarD family transcriptional regulator [Hyphomicrobiaceae bacterium]|nr:CarD family transcriptional regulator [Hyphomicrobiaceae bacterium]
MKAGSVKAGSVKAAPAKAASAKPVQGKPVQGKSAIAKATVAKAKPDVVAKDKKPAAKPVANAKAAPAAKVAAPVETVKAAAPHAAAAPKASAAKPAVKVAVGPGTAPKNIVAKAATAHKAAPQRAVAAASAPGTKKVAEPAVAAKPVEKKSVGQRHGFKMNEFVVYPAHGVGRIVGIEDQEIAGISLELFVITFDKEKLTLRVPTGKLESVGMRKLADEAVVRKALETLKGRARVKRTMWSRRAQEYVAKINSGDLVSIAEVVRDLYRSEAQPEQSYSERQLYEDALDRMAREIAAVDKLDERGAVQRITEVLSRSARGRRAAAEAAEAEAA